MLASTPVQKAHIERSLQSYGRVAMLTSESPELRAEIDTAIALVSLGQADDAVRALSALVAEHPEETNRAEAWLRVLTSAAVR